jgi:hypothetical protein
VSDWFFDVHAPDGIPDARLARFEDDEILRGTTVRHVTHGAASGNVLIVDALNAKAVHITRGACIKVYRAALSTSVPQTFFFVDKIETKVVGENEDYKVLVASGTGTLWHLANGILLDEAYSTDPSAPAGVVNEREEGMWVWGTDDDGQRMGPIMRRVYEEGRDQPSSVGDSPFYAVDADFNRSVDSNSVAWPAIGDEYRKPIGTSVLEVAQDVVASGLYLQMTGKSNGRLNLSCYQSMGADRAGSAFGAGVVRFVNLPNDPDNNIATDLTRQENDRQVSDLLISGAEFTYERAGDAGANMPRWETIAYPSSDPALLQLVAERNLTARNLAIDAIRFPLAQVGNAPTSGVYYISPGSIGGHAWMNDTVTVHTGAEQRDLNDADFPLAAWELRMEDDWEEWVEVGHVMIDSQRRAFEQAVSTIKQGCRCPIPGVPGVPGTDTGLIDWDWQDTGNQEFTEEYTALGQPVQMVQGTNHSGLYGSEYGARMYNVGDNYALPRVDVNGQAALIPATPGASYRIVWRSLRASNGTCGLGVDWYNGTYPFGVDAADLSQTVSSSIIKTWWQGATYFGSPPNYMSHSEVITAPAGVTAMRLNSGGEPWHFADISVAGVGTGTAGVPDGGGTHPDLVGTESGYYALFDHEHLVIRDRPPDSSDDLDAGYDRETLWYNTTSGVLWVSTDHTNGAAVWQAVETIPTDVDSGGETVLGDLTPSGTPTVLTNDSSHNAFPSWGRFSNGDVLLVYRKATQHIGGPGDGRIVGKLYDASAGTWGSEFTIWNPTNDARDVNVRIYDDIAYLTSTEGTGSSLSDTFTAKLLISTDHGSTWGSPISPGSAFSSGGSTREVGGQPIVRLSDDRLLWPIAGRLAADSTDTEKVIVGFSSDGGATWGGWVTVASVSGDFYTEPIVERLADGTLHMLIRRNDSPVNIYRSTSTDEGATWSSIAVIFAGQAKPAHRQLPSGYMLYVSRENPNGDTIYRTSIDGGATWTAEVMLDAVGTRNTYADIVSIDSQTAWVVYGREGSGGSSATDSDIVMEVFTDTSVIGSASGLVRVSALDAQAQYLGDKIGAGDGISITTQHTAGVQKLLLSADASGTHDHDADYAPIGHTHSGGSGGRWEVLMTGSGASLEPVTNDDETDWLYAEVS